MFELPSDPPEVSGELLQVLRLLALPPDDASRLLDGAHPRDDDEESLFFGGFGDPPIVSADGIDVWAALGEEQEGGEQIDRAAYAHLLRVCRRLSRELRDGAKQAAASEVAATAPAEMREAAAAAREAEASALRAMQAVARLRGGVRISRVPADTNRLFPTNANKLSRFMMEAMYGPCRPLTAAWAQRGVLDSTAASDLFARLRYYEEGTARGEMLMAEADGEIVGFADVSASLWLPMDRTFRLPAEVEGSRADGQLKAGVELRPYVSNLIVDASRRRSGVGRLLMEACEEAAAGWECAGAGMWLEVTATNKEGMGFYERLGYVVDGCTAGNEVVREGEGGFQMKEVERCILRKALIV